MGFPKKQVAMAHHGPSRPIMAHHGPRGEILLKSAQKLGWSFFSHGNLGCANGWTWHVAPWRDQVPIFRIHRYSVGRSFGSKSSASWDDLEDWVVDADKKQKRKGFGDPRGWLEVLLAELEPNWWLSEDASVHTIFRTQDLSSLLDSKTYRN